HAAPSPDQRHHRPGEAEHRQAEQHPEQGGAAREGPAEHRHRAEEQDRDHDEGHAHPQEHPVDPGAVRAALVHDSPCPPPARPRAACAASHCWCARTTVDPALRYHGCGPVLSSAPCVLRRGAIGTTEPSRSHSSTAPPGSPIPGTDTWCTCSQATKPRAPSIVDQETPRPSIRAQARFASRNSATPPISITTPTSTVTTAPSGSPCTNIAVELSAVMSPAKASTPPSHIVPELDPARTVVGVMARSALCCIRLGSYRLVPRQHVAQPLDRGCLTGGSPSSTSRVVISSPAPATSSSLSIRPSAVRSAAAASRCASAAAGASTVTARIGVCWGTLASDLMRRTTIAAWATESTSAESWPWAASRSGADSGQGWVCTEPPRHHDQTSSVANTITGANRRSSTSSAIASAARA